MKIITNIARVLVGLLFIYSGLIKANDTVGFAYKLVEYFEVFNTHFMVPAATPLSIFICIFEVALGFALMIGARMKLTLWLSMLMIIFFTFLTFYSAYFNKVTSCGCFGDAIKLTPWQSFSKDLILLVLLIVIIIGRQYINPLFSPKVENGLMIVAIAGSTAFPLYTYNYLPVKDYRPYKIGTNLYEAIHPKLKYFYKLKNKKSAEVKEFESWPENWDQEWDYVESRTENVTEGIEPIIGFSMQNQYGEDYTDEFLQKEGPKFILVEYDLNKSNRGVQPKINDFAALCAANNIEFVALTSSDTTLQKLFIKENNITYPFYTNLDDVPLKTMIRSNPGLVMLDGPTVVAMWHYHSFPSFNELKAEGKYIK
jgi:uncharacterized membrane protein YphA (DoxX/SURF4 family)